MLTKISGEINNDDQFTTKNFYQQTFSPE